MQESINTTAIMFIMTNTQRHAPHAHTSCDNRRQTHCDIHLDSNMFPDLTQDVSSSQSTPRLVSERFALPPTLSSASFKIRSDKGQRGEEDGGKKRNEKLGSKSAIVEAFSDF